MSVAPEPWRSSIGTGVRLCVRLELERVSNLCPTWRAIRNDPAMLPAGPCVSCGERTSTEQWAYFWTAMARVKLSYPLAETLWLLLGIFRPRVERHTLPLVTVHSFCRRCATRARWQRVC